ncbi:DEAD/DEAH box helicase family protein [Soonwooa sp.]|uniref:DEAD/DEAH box helicase family protein n=1 Tax=Soonwooa sp. TaxID=1938592 RepID=UPI002621C5E2|nr:DEAD/DEAH box helicase family protein [Soonwooa sp.]
MTGFPENISFRYPWRDYQQRLLENFESYLQDNQVYIIAPPGSGKTVLGLEMLLRINKPTLILAPTNTIKNQWLDRFLTLFLDLKEKPDWISLDVNKPSFLTIDTYQALNAVEKDPKRFNALIKSMKEVKFSCLVLDEAHHLKKEWYRSLAQLQSHFEIVNISLTATPPYDSAYAEWLNYITLNGTVDAEISVPELVKEKSLCAHQDFVYYNFPSRTEYESIEKIKEKSNQVFNDFINDNELYELLTNLSIVKSPQENEQKIFQDFSFYSAVIIFLKFKNFQFPLEHFEVIGANADSIPDLTPGWLSLLLTKLLLTSDYENYVNEKQKKQWIQNLRSAGVLGEQTINFRLNNEVDSLLAQSINKLESIIAITELEFSSLKENLRLVILTDYIRKEFISTSSQNNIVLNRIGVFSIFESLRRKDLAGFKMAVLTGSLVVLPKSVEEAFLKKCADQNIVNLKLEKLTYDENFVLINVSDSFQNKLVGIITELFEEGYFQTIIGTKALLGEGWDAPCINSIILASFVGSFVLSNQMRGRALRLPASNLTKTSNVWHLVSVNPLGENGGNDMTMMQRRFKAFVGVDYNNDLISNNFSRLHLPVNSFALDKIEMTNQASKALATQRYSLLEKWEKAISNGHQMLDEFAIPEEVFKAKKTKRFYFDKSVRNVFAMLTLGIASFSWQGILVMLKNFLGTQNIWSVFHLGWIFTAIGALMFAKPLYKSFKLWYLYKEPISFFSKICEVVFELLKEEKLVTSKGADLITEMKNGQVSCYLENANSNENSVFFSAINEVFSAIDSPKYFIKTEDKLWKGRTVHNYFNVPQIFSKTKNQAQRFSSLWETQIGVNVLYLSWNLEGRKELVKARFNAYFNQFENQSQIITEWK